MFDPKWRHQVAKTLVRTLLAFVIVLSLASCGSGAITSGTSKSINPRTSNNVAKIAEISPPQAIQQLRQELDNHQPQVTILSPQPNEVLQDNTVTVKFQVQDLPIFKNKDLGLGPHLHVLLDNQSYTAVYDLKEPLVFKDLAPGTHTIRAFASRPWHESFKNEGAYAQTTFHIFTKTDENNPDPNLPLLTYSRPQGSYGAEPIMLDFYLSNAPLHLVAQENPEDEISDWRIRCTINGESFIIDQWQPIYLTGFHPGKNWVQVELLDEQGNPIKNIFNNTARLITYEPGGTDTLSKLIRGEISVADARGIVDPNYIPTPPAPPVTTPTIEETPQPTVETAPTPIPTEAAQPVVETSPTPTPAETTEAKLEPKAAPSIETPTEQTTAKEPIKPVEPEKETKTEESAPEAEIPATPAEEPSSGLPPTLPEIIETTKPESPNPIAPVPPVGIKAKLKETPTPTLPSQNGTEVKVEAQETPAEKIDKSAEQAAATIDSSDVVEATPSPASLPAPTEEVKKVETPTPKSVTSETSTAPTENKAPVKSEASKPLEKVAPKNPFQQLFKFFNRSGSTSEVKVKALPSLPPTPPEAIEETSLPVVIPPTTEPTTEAPTSTIPSQQPTEEPEISQPEIEQSETSEPTSEIQEVAVPSEVSAPEKIEDVTSDVKPISTSK